MASTANVRLGSHVATQHRLKKEQDESKESLDLEDLLESPDHKQTFSFLPSMID